MSRLPRLFIGSSSDARSIVDRFVESLSRHASCIPWWQAPEFKEAGASTTLQSLRVAVFQYDFALFVLNPDHRLFLYGAGDELWCVRDNVLFEFGLFLGSLGTERVFLARREIPGKTFRIPTDLLGVQSPSFTYEDSDSQLNTASVNSVCSGFKQSIDRLSFMPINLTIAEKWGADDSRTTYDVILGGARLVENLHFFQNREFVLASRIKNEDLNFEDDSQVIFSQSRSVADPPTELKLSVPLKEMEDRANTRVTLSRTKPYSVEARVLLVPRSLRVSQFRNIGDAKRNGILVVDRVSSIVQPPKKSRDR